MRPLFDAIQRLNQIQSQKAGSPSSTIRPPTNTNGNNASWFDIQRNIKTKLRSSPQERSISNVIYLAYFILHIICSKFLRMHINRITATALYARAT